MKDPTQIIIQPLLTEKSVQLQQLNKYTFEVTTDATKVEIGKAIEALGGCRVEKVNTLTIKGKIRRTKRGSGKTPQRKKAIVTLREGEALTGVLGEAFGGV